jgi:hypothetical protein
VGIPTRGELLENFAGDLEFNPRRAIVYFVFGAAALYLWFRGDFALRYPFIPPVLGLGGLALIVKAVFLLRKNSDGLGLNDQPIGKGSVPVASNKVSPITQDLFGLERIAQIIQDFGVGPLLLGLFLDVTLDPEHPVHDPRKFPVLLSGAVLFAGGLILRHLANEKSISNR